MNRRTDTQTHGRTNRLIESIGPKGRCFEKKKKLEEEEKLLAEREEFHSELDMDRDIGEEKEQDAFLPPSSTKDECKIKDNEKEVNVLLIVCCRKSLVTWHGHW